MKSNRYERLWAQQREYPSTSLKTSLRQAEHLLQSLLKSSFYGVGLSG